MHMNKGRIWGTDTLTNTLLLHIRLPFIALLLSLRHVRASSVIYVRKKRAREKTHWPCRPVCVCGRPSMRFRIANSFLYHQVLLMVSNKRWCVLCFSQVGLKHINWRLLPGHAQRQSLYIVAALNARQTRSFIWWRWSDLHTMRQHQRRSNLITIKSPYNCIIHV